MPYYCRPFLPILLAMMLGVAAGAWFPDHRPWAYGLVMAIFSGLVFLFIKNKRSVFALYFLFLGLGYLLIQPWVTPHLPEHHISKFIGKTPRIITGVVDTPPFQTGFRQKFNLKVTSLGTGSARRLVTGCIRVSVAKPETPIFAGDLVTFVGTIKAIRSFQNGGFNYQRYMAYRRIWVSVSVKGRSLRVIDHPGLSGIAGWMAPARCALATQMEVVLAPEHAGILKALVLGDKRGISEAQRECFQRAGIGHLLAISGLHVGIMASATFYIVSFILGYIPFLLFHAWTKKGAAFVSIVIVWAYGLLAGMSPSTFRAVIMTTVFLTAILLGRKQDSVTSLAVAALVILVWDPPALFSISFQLSFVAVAAIVSGLGVVSAFRKSTSDAFWQRAIKRIAMFMWVSLFAIIGTLPLVLYYFNQTSTVGLVSNLIFIPLLGLCMVPMGLLSAVLFPFSVALSTGGFKLCSIGLGICLPWIQWFAALPFAITRLVTPSQVEIVLYYGIIGTGVGLIYWWRHHPEERSGARFMARQQGIWIWPQRILPLLFAILLLIAVTDVFYWVQQRFWSSDLKATVIDVGHGSATLLEIPKGGTMLVDGGGFSDNAAFDVGKRVVAPLLWQRKIKTIDTVVLTHPNSDHLNGLIYILKHFDVKCLWTSHERVDTKGYREFEKAVNAKCIRWPAYPQIKQHHVFNDVAVDLLYPPTDFAEKRERWRNSNNNSLVLKVSFGMFAFLVPGDIMAAGERELVAMVPGLLQSDVLLAPHHGSRTSSTVSFLKTVMPKLVIVSSGGANLRRGLQPDVLVRYHDIGAKVFMTRTQGAVRLITDGTIMKTETTAAPIERWHLYCNDN